MAEVLTALAIHCRVGASSAFAWGRMDCTCWVADWVKARTGADAMAAWRGRYRSRLGQARLLRRGAGGPTGAASRGLQAIGVAEIDPPAARPGDIGIIETVDGPAMALRGQLGWLAKTGDGLYRCPAAIKAWRL
ncbi:hypothetical protein [Inquilinus sp. Marseille-Q2685]|uniref:DUF6950 family protein n=1 Tax=Inquilinus sp. Marseille-Q2685 TaxID=2866581 RepID=UPI001CE3B838|nr:hypothetical protein [Inquilinus sp. Marseille-Q2685]